MKSYLDEIVELTKFATSAPTKTIISDVMVIRGDVPEHQLAAIYEPTIGFTVHGRKIISIGDQVIDAKGPSYYIIPTDVPATAKVRQGTNGQPYLSIGLRLNRDMLFSLIETMGENFPQSSSSREFQALNMTAEFLEAWVHLLRLLKSPEHVFVLAPLYEREILYRALIGPQGWQLRQLCFESGSSRKIEQAVRWIRQNFAKPIDVKPVALKAGMAVTTFHRQFKQFTGLSPIQFQKQLRLLEARKLMVFAGHSVSEAAFSVGYESASQFNREYTRHFGTSPARDASKVRQMEEGKRTG